MIDTFLLVASQVITLFLMMGAGFILAKRGMITREGVPQITAILLNVVVPCLIVNSLQTEKNTELLLELGYVVLGMTAIYGISAIVLHFMFGKKPENTRAPLRFSVIYGNTGFMGLPLIQAVLGDEALIYASVVFVVFIIFNWTHGVVQMGGKEYFSPKHIIFNPGIIGSIIGITLFWFEITLPATVGNAVGFLAEANTPMAMVIIGAQMAWADIPSTFRKPLLYQGASLKLIVIPVIAAIALLPFSLSPLIYCTLIILTATPTASVAAMFAVRFHRDEEFAVQMVTLTTLLSVITLPLMGALAYFWSY